MTQRFEKWPKYLGNDLDTWDMALVFEKRLYYVGNGLRIKNVENDIEIQEMAEIFRKWLKYL